MKWCKNIIIPEILQRFLILQKSQKGVYIWLLTHSLTVKVTRLLTSSCGNLFDKFLTSLFRPRTTEVAGIKSFGTAVLLFHSSLIWLSGRGVWSRLSDNNPLPLLPSDFFYADEGLTKSLDTTWECHFLSNTFWVVVVMLHRDELIILFCPITAYQITSSSAFYRKGMLKHSFKLLTEPWQSFRFKSKGFKCQRTQSSGSGGKIVKPWKLDWIECEAPTSPLYPP